MLGGILQAGISTKVVLLNFEIINEYGDKRSCKLVFNEGSSFTDTLVKLRVKHENYQIQLNGEKLDWSDKILMSHNNKHFSVLFNDSKLIDRSMSFDDNISDPSDEDNISDPDDDEINYENKENAFSPIHLSMTADSETGLLNLDDKSGHIDGKYQSFSQNDLSPKTVIQPQNGLLNPSFADHSFAVIPQQSIELKPIQEGGINPSVIEPLNPSLNESSTSTLQAQTNPNLIVGQLNKLEKSVLQLKIVVLVQLIIIILLLIFLILSIFWPWLSESQSHKIV